MTLEQFAQEPASNWEKLISEKGRFEANCWFIDREYGFR